MGPSSPQFPDPPDAEQALAEYLRRLDAGEEVDVDALCRKYPEHSATIRDFVQSERAFAEILDQTSRNVRDGMGEGQADALVEERAFPPNPPGYEIKALIGQGGMGVVYRATQSRVGRDVALKYLPPAFAADPDRLHRFRREAVLAASLRDAHILPVFDVIEQSGAPVLVLPLAEADLDRVIEDRRPDAKRPAGERHPWSTLGEEEYLNRVLALLDQLLDAVAALHAAEIVHRDIKPSNLLLDRHGNLWLSDFGLARLGGECGMTRSNAMVGTVGFMSPEQIESRPDIDARADQFGVAATAYQALTLKLPYGKSVLELFRKPPAAPSKRQRRLARGFDGVLLKALEPRREDRYANTEDFLADWRRVRAGLDPHARPPGRLRRGGRWLWRRRWSVAVSLVFFAAGVFFAIGPKPGPRYEVRVPTQPAASRGVLVPIDESTGAFQPRDRRRGRPRGDGTLTFDDVPPGEYLVVVVAPGHGFIEVERTVPAPDQAIGIHPQDEWERVSEDVIELPLVTIVDAEDSPIEFARVVGGEFSMGSHHPLAAPSHVVRIDDFEIGTVEVTVAQYQAVMGELPTWLREQAPPPDPDDPVSFVSYDQARQFCELIGARLPDEREYEYPATRRGSAAYPWGNARHTVDEWETGWAALDGFDRTDDAPPIRGLFSGVAEWTSSRGQFEPVAGAPTLVPGANADGAFPIPASFLRAVRGGAPGTASGRPDATGYAAGSRLRWLCFVDSPQAGLGFRCARSLRPRFLDD